MNDQPAPKVLQDRYEIQSTIGSGGAGSVYKAWDRSLQRFVAVKRFSSAQTQGDALDERAWREAMAMAAIHHPNILTIYDFGIDEDGPFVIMEYLEGETVEAVCRHGTYGAKDLREAVRQTLEGLIAAHHTGLIHRDLKPHNVMVLKLASGAMQYKILDFGLAKIMTKPTAQTLEGNTAIYGSVHCIAPEQLGKRPVDARTDLYAMGCVYYYMLAGQNAFDGESVLEIITAHLKHRVTPLHQLRPDLPAAMCDWVMNLLETNPDKRPASAAEALASFQKTLPTTTIKLPGKVSPATGKVPTATSAGLPPPPAEPEKKTEAKKKRDIPVAQIVVGGVVLALVVYILWPMPNRKKKVVPARPSPAPAAVTPARPSRPAPVARPTPEPAPEPAREPEEAVQPREARPAPAPPAIELEPVRFAAPADEPTVFDAVVFAPTALSEFESRVGQMATVKGRVVGVRRAAGKVYFDFDKDRTRAVSVCFDNDQPSKQAVYDKLKTYRNVMVRVRGKVELDGSAVQIRTGNIAQLDELPPLGL